MLLIATDSASHLGLSLADLAVSPQWMAWRNDLRGGDKPTKVPYCAPNRQAKADDPSTWLTHDRAAALAKDIANGAGGGVGIGLGPCGGLWLAGVDLDSCRDPRSGAIEPWAQEVLDRLDTYAEFSPSRTGVKAFFMIDADDVEPLREMMGTQHGRQFKRACGASHPPAIELYVSNRYFAVTWQQLGDAPTELRMVGLDDLRWLIEQAGPALTGKTSGSRDGSRSAAAFRKGAALRKSGATYEEMCDMLRTDPETADWYREKGEPNNQRELQRIWDRAGAPASSRPPIRVVGGNRHEAADAGLAALNAAGVPFFQRDGALVRVCRMSAKACDGSTVTVPAVKLLTAPMLERALGQAARWEIVNHQGKTVPIDPPAPVVKQLAGMIDEWPFSVLSGVICTPTMRPDGSLLTTEGYDPDTGFILFSPPAMPPIPDSPTKQDAENALAILDELLVEFPFANGASRSVALSMLLTPVLRAALGPAVPMHVITSPEAGTGKSFLQDVVAAIATGDRCAVFSMSSNPHETEKRLIGAALAQLPIIALDNVSDLLFGDFLCQVTERPVLQLRRLGTSDLDRVPNTFTVFANGNNLTVSADTVRRTIQCTLDAKMESPETREFLADPVRAVLADRGKYVAACLTIARAYIVAGSPDRTSRRASYEGWSDIVRSALVWLGCDDPVETVAALKADDPIRQQRAAVFSAWAEELAPESGYQTAELISPLRANSSRLLR